MELVQLAPGARVVVQVVAERMNEVALVPVTAAAEVKVVGVVVLVFLMVMTWAAVVVPRMVEAKVSDVGVKVSVGTARPVPLRATVWVLPVALSLYVTAAARAPATVGLNSMESVQLAPGARVVVQVVAESRNDVALVPVTAAAEVKVVGVVVLVFLMVMTWAAVVVPRIVEAKVNEVGVKVSVGTVEVAVPLRATVCGELAALSAA
jgi:hypothetical protein